MKKSLLAIGLALAATLTACATTGGSLPVTPARTAAQVVGTADSAYIAASSAGQQLAALGTITHDQFVAFDNEAYAALLSLRSTAAAYRAGTIPQTDLTTANLQLAKALAALRAGRK